MSRTKEFIKNIPILGKFLCKLKKKKPFTGSSDYWETRYASGDNSGVGSYNKFAEFKAKVINSFIKDNNINSVIEFGCGDGNQLTLAEYPTYLGLDISETVISLCRKKFSNDPSKRFESLNNYAGETAELSLSLDVIYHLVEDEIFQEHINNLFKAASRYVIIY